MKNHIQRRSFWLQHHRLAVLVQNMAIQTSAHERIDCLLFVSVSCPGFSINSINGLSVQLLQNRHLPQAMQQRQNDFAQPRHHHSSSSLP
jgi:hypothetical protein